MTHPSHNLDNDYTVQLIDLLPSSPRPTAHFAGPAWHSASPTPTLHLSNYSTELLLPCTGEETINMDTEIYFLSETGSLLCHFYFNAVSDQANLVIRLR